MSAQLPQAHPTHGRNRLMTTVSYPTTARRRLGVSNPSLTGRIAISLGTALAGWGERRASRPKPLFVDQTRLFEATRHRALHDSPVPPR